MALKPESLLLLACLLMPLNLAAAGASLDIPQGVTLTVDGAGSGTLVWDPLNRDDLMGYSVWMRKGMGEFTRLNIPTLVGKELKKLPMTTKSSLTIKGVGRLAVELTVVAEYESGRSEQSITAYSTKARRVEPAQTATNAASGLSKTADTRSETSASRESESPEKSVAASPLRSVMAPQGKLRSAVNGGMLWEQTVARGYNTMSELGYYVVGNPNYDYNRSENWTITYTRRKIEIPLSLEYGLLSAVEIGGEISYVQDRCFAGKFDFGTDTFQSYNSEAAVEGSGFGNPSAKIRIQPSSALSLRLSLRANLSTGSRSRLQSYGEYLWRTSKLAGLDDNAGRLEIRADFGDKGSQPGLCFSLGITPASTETANAQRKNGGFDKHRAERGQEVFGILGYNIPWSAESYPGSLSAGLSLRSIDPGRWFVNDFDAGAVINKDDRAALRSFTGINLGREDQFVLFLDLLQNIYSLRDRHGLVRHAIDSGGKIEFTIKPDGYIIAVSGGFYY